jgi:hypothetical protein
MNTVKLIIDVLLFLLLGYILTLMDDFVLQFFLFIAGILFIVIFTIFTSDISEALEDD